MVKLVKLFHISIQKFQGYALLIIKEGITQGGSLIYFQSRSTDDSACICPFDSNVPGADNLSVEGAKSGYDLQLENASAQLILIFYNKHRKHFNV